jgi:hypothetical protein
MIHQNAQNTLFFYSSLQVIKCLKQTLQRETLSLQCRTVWYIWYMNAVLKAPPASVFRLSSIFWMQEARGLYIPNYLDPNKYQHLCHSDSNILYQKCVINVILYLNRMK